jgi:hypothetical protein
MRPPVSIPGTWGLLTTALEESDMPVSYLLEGPLDWADATVAGGDAVDVVARRKEESAVPLRSHGSLSLNRAQPLV